MSLIFLPSSPALVPELGRGDRASAELLAAAREVISATCAQENCDAISVVGSRSAATFTAHTGSFRAWGAPEVTVGAGNYLAELVARFVVRDMDVRIEVAEIHRPKAGELQLCLLDGPAGLSEKAPLSLVTGAARRHDWCQRLLSGDEVAWPDSSAALLADAIVEPDTWWQLRCLRPTRGQLHCVQDAHGVGRYLAQWWFEEGGETQ